MCAVQIWVNLPRSWYWFSKFHRALIFTSDWNKSQWCKGDAEVARKWSEFQTGCRPLNANLLTSFFQSLPHRLWSSPLSPFLDGTKVFSICISVKKSLQHISLRGKMFATPSFGITVPLTSQRKNGLSYIKSLFIKVGAVSRRGYSCNSYVWDKFGKCFFST